MKMIDLPLLAYTSLFIWGVHCLFKEPFILYKWGYNIERIIGSHWVKPLYRCPPCMSSVYGLPVAYYNYGISLDALFFVICLCGLNYLLKTLVYPEYEDTP